MSLSVIIITRDEAQNIRGCLESVAFADEWIVVDSGSSDATVAIAREFGARVIQTPDWPGYGPQKARALAAATGDWVLSIDADERITPALRDELRAAMANPGHTAYELPRMSSFYGHFIRHAGWYPDRVVRLFRRGSGNFSDDLVHERVIVAGGSIGRLRSPMLHYSYPDDDVYLRKLAQYSTLGAQQAFAAGARGGLGKAIAHAIAAFLRSWIFKRGILDGRGGLMVAISAAESTYHKYLKLMLLSRPPPAGATMRARHVLLCRTDNIGDVVLTLPVATYLKQLQPATRVSFLCRAYAAPVVRLCKSVDQVVEVESIGDPAGWMAGAGIDTIIFCHPDRALAAAARRAKIPERVGTGHRWYHWLYCNRLAHFSRAKSQLHEAQLNFKLLAPLGIAQVPSRSEIPALYQLSPPPGGLPAEMDPGEFNLVLHPKSNGNGREWPIEHFTALADLLGRVPGVRIWITGTAGEGEWVRRHAPQLLAQPQVRDVCGRFTLAELTRFIAAADGLVASGTGPLHVSAAIGTPTLGLFPPLKPIDPGRWGALGHRADVLCAPGPCASCAEPAVCRCMRAITPEQVASHVLQWREANGRQLRLSTFQSPGLG